MADFRCAVAELQRATQLNPEHLDAQVKLAELMTTAKSKDVLEDAQSLLHKVLTTSPEDAEALQALGLVELRLGNLDDAEAHLKEAIEKAPQELKVAFNLARLKILQKDIPGAETVLKKAVESNPASITAILALADLYTMVRRLPEAEHELREALKAGPHDGRTLTRLGEFLYSQKRLDEAEKLFAEASALPDARYKPAHAIFLFSSGKRELAIQEFEKLARENPADRDARKRLSAAYQTAGRSADAERLWREALKSNPKDADALVERGRLYLLSRKYAEAEADISAVIKQQPDNADARYLLAKIFGGTGQKSRQLEELSNAIRFDAAYLSARTDLASLLLGMSAPSAALQYLEQAPAQQQDLLPIVVYRSWANLALGNKLQARRDIDRALQFSHNRNVLLLDAAYRLNEQDFSGARKSIKEALEQNSDDLGALNVLVQTYEAQRQFPSAIPEVRTFATRVPGSAPIQNFLGQILVKGGDPAQARQAFLAALKARSGYPPALLEIAKLDLGEGKLTEAASGLTAILAANPSYLQAHLLLGAVEERRSNFTQAIAEYRKALELDDRNKMALNNLAYVLAEYGNQPDEALRLAQKATEISPNEPAVQDTLGWVYYQKGLYPQAVQQLEAATGKSSAALPKFHLGLAYLKSGDRRGQKLIADAMALDPTLARSPALQSLPR